MSDLHGGNRTNPEAPAASSPSLQDRQLLIIFHYQSMCLEGEGGLPFNGSTSRDMLEGFSCPLTWDGIYCWPDTPAGTLARAPCPHYLDGFDPTGMASKQCDVNGTWWINPSLNQTWTNYSLCARSSVFAVHVPVITSISQTGYSVSLTLLLLACLILGSIRRLRCPRNNLHLQLFASFILRAAVSLLRGITSPITGTGPASQHNSTWCRALTSVWQYCLMANYSWILMEGLYLHNLLFLSIFSDNAGILKYALAGWGSPLLFVVPWIIVRATLDDNLCWTVNDNSSYFWIIRGPTIASILLNLFFFLNISRVLFLKMFSNQAANDRNRYKYRKWFKSTLVLVPLFGVHYALLLSFSFATGGNQTLEMVWLYFDQTFTSFQGSFVAFLYCFLNGEVKAEVRKLFDRLREKEGGTNPQHSLLTQSLTYLSKGRASVQSLHTVADRRDHWKSSESGERQNWGESLNSQRQQTESLL